MRDIAANLAGRGWHLRTGGAKGADDAFARAVPAERRTVFIPWRGYNGWSGSEGRALTAGELQALRAAAEPHHPAWRSCAPSVRDLHARNVAILMGADMREPVTAMVCWTENGRVQGGTGMAIRLARHYRIPVLNLAELDMRAAMDRLDRIGQTRDRRDVAQDQALPNRSAEGRPSETAKRPQSTRAMRIGGVRKAIGRRRQRRREARPGNAPCISEAADRPGAGQCGIARDKG